MKCKSTTIKKPLVVLCFDRTKKVSLSFNINTAFYAYSTYNILSCNVTLVLVR